MLRALFLGLCFVASANALSIGTLSHQPSAMSLRPSSANFAKASAAPALPLRGGGKPALEIGDVVYWHGAASTLFAIQMFVGTYVESTKSILLDPIIPYSLGVGEKAILGQLSATALGVGLMELAAGEHLKTAPAADKKKFGNAFLAYHLVLAPIMIFNQMGTGAFAAPFKYFLGVLPAAFGIAGAVAMA